MTNAWRPPVCEIAFGVPGAIGVEFEGTATLPAGCEGQLQFLQLCNFCVERHPAAGGDWRRRKTDGWVLDSEDPYSETGALAGPGEVSHTDEDSPGFSVDGTDQTFVKWDNFKMWLLWKPSTPAGAPRVALGMVPWDWKGKATKTGHSGGCTADWTLSQADAHGGTGSATSTMPFWSKVFPADVPEEPGRC